MILLLDTSTATCNMSLVRGATRTDVSWQADKNLAHGLLHFVVEQLSAHGSSLEELTGLGLYRGPGSFTGLRIGAATFNTIADTQTIPIVGVVGENWQDKALQRLREGENDVIVLPEYGREARITKPRK